MSYPIQVKIVSNKGYHTPAQALAYYGRYSRDGVTVHWWNTPDKVKDSDHDNIVNYITNKAANGTGSVNYVLSNNKITLLVNPDNVAWASQDGNPTTVSVEFSPHLNAEGYKKAGWLINELFNTKNGRYKKAPRLWKHSDWFSTQCPGTLDLSRMLAEAKKWADGAYNPKPAPAPVPTPQFDFRAFGELREYVANKNTHLYDMNTTTWSGVKNVKAYKKGEKIQVAGTVLNRTLNSTHLITQYSLEKKIPNGFSQVDWDRVIPPVVVPEPPKPDPEQPPTYEPTIPERLTALEKAVEMIVNFLKSIFKGFGG